jgi:hypothetical protein
VILIVRCVRRCVKRSSREAKSADIACVRRASNSLKLLREESGIEFVENPESTESEIDNVDSVGSSVGSTVDSCFGSFGIVISVAVEDRGREDRKLAEEDIVEEHIGGDGCC